MNMQQREEMGERRKDEDWARLTCGSVESV